MRTLSLLFIALASIVISFCAINITKWYGVYDTEETIDAQMARTKQFVEQYQGQRVLDVGYNYVVVQSEQQIQTWDNRQKVYRVINIPQDTTIVWFKSRLTPIVVIGELIKPVNQVIFN
jgi:hypothetical protein